MKLQEFITEQEKKLGRQSSSYHFRDHKGTKHGAAKIPFDQRPGTQLIKALGGIATEDTYLSTRQNSKSEALVAKQDVVTNGFSFAKHPIPNQPSVKLEAARLTRLINSGKIYVNVNGFHHEGLYKEILDERTVKALSAAIYENGLTKIHWQNMALAVCHAQEIDLLVQVHTEDEETVFSPLPEGCVKKADDPALLLLSTPYLKFSHLVGHGLAGHLKDWEALGMLQVMYRNACHAAVSEERKYLLVLGPGFPHYHLLPDIYFEALGSVAKEFPQLQIVFHPVDHEKRFDDYLSKEKPTNLVKSKKHIVALANQLTQTGHACALLNPTHSDVIYGNCDIGKKCKIASSHDFTHDTFFHDMTTAAINSYGLNPAAYQRINEKKLVIVYPDQQPAIPNIEQPHQTPIPAQSNDINVPLAPAEEKQPTPKASPKITANPSPFFNPNPDLPISEQPKEKQVSCLSDMQIRTIQETILQLEKEIHCCWPYPNKNLKRVKVEALTLLMQEAKIKPIQEAIATVKNTYPKCVEGTFSKRTAHLLETLANGQAMECSEIKVGRFGNPFSCIL